MEIAAQAYQEKCMSSIERIFASLDEVFTQSGLQANDVNELVITGGSGRFPLVRTHLEKLFGAQKLKSHKTFESVVTGLGRFAQKLHG